MVLSYFFDATETSFDDQLLEDIKEKANDKLATLLNNTKDLYNKIDIFGASLLHYAAEFGNENIVSHLVKLGSKVNLQNSEGCTPLLLAAKGQHLATVKVLFDADADMNICDSEDNNALKAVLLAQPMNVEIAKIFLDQLETDCSSNSVEIAEKLMKINCPLYVAALLKNGNVTRCMLGDCCPIDAKDPVTGKTALHVAVEILDVEQVVKLIDLGADVNAKDASNKTPLAMLNNYFDDWTSCYDILNDLLAAKAEITSCDNDGLMQVASILKNAPQLAVQSIMSAEFDISTTDQHKQNILHYLVKNSNKGVVEVVEVVEDVSAIDLNARDEDDLTVLHHAMYAGNTDFVKFLCENDVNVHIANNKGVTPFLKAIESTSESTLEKRVECVKILLKGNLCPDLALGSYFKFYNTKSAVNRDLPLLEPVLAELAMNKESGHVHSREIYKRIESYPKLKEYFDTCMSELDKMKKDFLANDMSLLDAIEKFRFEDPCWKVSVIMDKIYGSRMDDFAEKYKTIEFYHEIIVSAASYLWSWKAHDKKWLKNTFVCLTVAVIVFLIIFLHFSITSARYYERAINFYILLCTILVSILIRMIEFLYKLIISIIDD